MASLKSKWELGWSEEYRRYYYMDRVNGRSQWSRPNGCTLDADAATKEVNAKSGEGDKAAGRKSRDASKAADHKYPESLPEGWEAYKDAETGKWFFYNKATKLRTWYKPAVKAEADGQKEKKNIANRPIKNQAQEQKLAEEKKQKVQEMVNQLHDPKMFLRRLEDAVENGPIVTKQVLSEVKSTNDDLVSFKSMHIPQTIPVTYKECIKALIERQVQGYRMAPSISISERTTGQAINFFASDPKRVVCALNFASGTKDSIGSTYAEGGEGQEEDLCRRCSTLYESFKVAADMGHYPFGPSTCTSEKDPQKYCDVLFTPHTCKDKFGMEVPGLLLSRGRYEEGYPILSEDQSRRCCLVSAAAPRVKDEHSAGKDKSKKADIINSTLLFQLVTSIFVAPVLKEPSCTTLVLGAWGCGKEGNNPVQIAQLFAEAMTRKLPSLDFCLGSLYHEIHFAIPAETADDRHHRTFFQVFEKNNITATII